MFILINRQWFKQQKPIITRHMLHLNRIQYIQVIISTSNYDNRIASIRITTPEVYPFIPHTLHAYPTATVEILTVSQVSHELTLYFTGLHVATYYVYFVHFGDEDLLVECSACFHRHAVG